MSEIEQLQADVVFYTEVLAAIGLAAAARQKQTRQRVKLNAREQAARDTFDRMLIGATGRLRLLEVQPQLASNQQ